MRLYFLRHGEAVEKGNLQDAQRPLTEHGVAQARLIGSLLLNSGVQIDAILTSPLVRAKQTADIVRETLGLNAVQTSEHLLPSSDRRRLYALLSSFNAGAILMVGHEPHLSETVSDLIAGDHQARIDLGKCALARVDTEGGVEEGRGILRLLIPREFSEAVLHEGEHHGTHHRPHRKT